MPYQSTIELTADVERIKQREACKRRLEERVADTADEIAVWRDYPPEKMAGYLQGVREVIEALAEWHEVQVNTDPLRAAFGEYEQRMGIQPATSSRLLNRLLTEAREFRREFRQARVDWDYAGWFNPRMNKLRKLERRGGIEDWEAFNQAKLEYRSLFDFILTVRTPDWFRKREEVLKLPKAA